LRKVFDFRRTLLQPNAQSYGFLDAWSDVTADKFLPEYFPEHIPFELKCQALVAQLHLREKQERFMRSKGENGMFMSRVLVLSGKGYI
jgi:hypothetical protein